MTNFKAASRHLERGGTITTDADNDLLRWEEGYAPLTAPAIDAAWLHWFRSANKAAPKAPKVKK